MKNKKDLKLIKNARENLIIFFVLVFFLNFLFLTFGLINPVILINIQNSIRLSGALITFLTRFILLFLVINLALLLKFRTWTIILYSIASLLPFLFWIPVIILLYESKKVLKDSNTIYKHYGSNQVKNNLSEINQNSEQKIVCTNCGKQLEYSTEECPLCGSSQKKFL